MAQNDERAAGVGCILGVLMLCVQIPLFAVLLFEQQRADVGVGDLLDLLPGRFHSRHHSSHV